MDTNDMELLILEEQKEKVKKLKIANEQALEILIPVRFYDGMLRAVQRLIQTSFVDVPRRDAPDLAAEIGHPEKEAVIREALAGLIESGLVIFEKGLNGLSLDEILRD